MVFDTAPCLGTASLLWQHFSQFFVAKTDFVNRLLLIFEGNVIAVEVGGEEDFYEKREYS